METEVNEIQSHPEYPSMFYEAFQDSTVTIERVSNSIAQFLRTLKLGDSKFDKWQKGETSLTERERRGYEIYFTEPRVVTSHDAPGADCFHCHDGGGLFTTSGATGEYFNTGLDSVYNEEKNEPFRYEEKAEYEEMHWPEHLGGGYHYMMKEGFFLPSEDDEESFLAYNTHTGMVVYKDEGGQDSIIHENSFKVTLEDLEFEIAEEETLRIDLEMEVTEWYENPVTYDLMGNEAIMSNQEAQRNIRENGPSSFSLSNLEVE